MGKVEGPVTGGEEGGRLLRRRRLPVSFTTGREEGYGKRIMPIVAMKKKKKEREKEKVRSSEKVQKNV